MRKYYVRYGDFGNTYSLCYTEDGGKPSGDGWEQITRKEAEALARAEVRRRKDDPYFSGYADAWIFPVGMTENDEINFACLRGWHTEGRLAVKD